ncbi:hypothetical protein AAVH_20363, partial [Aphelenchoides avenae]
RVVDSDVLSDLTGRQSSLVVEKEETLSKARKHFIFDAHQQCCDKALREALSDLRQIIKNRFNTEELVERLKQDSELTNQEKVELWEQIKLRSFARILAVSFAYSLLTLAFKTQKSILCQETCRHLEASKKQGFVGEGFVNYITSFFRESEGRNRSASFSDPKAQQLFSNCIHFLNTQGVNLLFNRIEAVSEEVMGKVSLAKAITISEIKDLLEQAKFKLIASTGTKNFSDLVVPLTQPKFRMHNEGVVHLEELLTRFVTVLQSQRCTNLMASFTQLYVNDAVQTLELSEAADKARPLAKLLPLLSDSYSSVSSTKDGSVLHQTLISSELYQFALFVFSDESHHNLSKEKRIRMPNEPRLLKFATYLSACAPEGASYGTCVGERAEKVRKDDCQKEFHALLTCFKKQAVLVTMKINRYKRAQRILTFFRYSFGYEPPHTVLVDGTFSQAALQNKINLREQMPKYLGEGVEMVTTKCVLAELEQLGSAVYGALVICKQFTVARCPHTPARTAAECLAHLARRSKKPGLPKYFVATQDDTLLAKLRELGGVPLMSVRFNTILLEKQSSQSIAESKTPEEKEIEKAKELKKAVLGEDEQPKPRKRKGPKGPNPLSCKKKKKAPPHAVNGAFGKPASAEPSNEADGTKRRRRRGKKDSEEGESQTQERLL